MNWAGGGSVTFRSFVLRSVDGTHGNAGGGSREARSGEGDTWQNQPGFADSFPNQLGCVSGDQIYCS